MMEFDKKIKELSKEFQVPEEYHKKVDGILETIQEESMPVPKGRISIKLAGIVVLLCLFMVGCFCFSGTEVAEASPFESFKQTIMDFLGMGEEESHEIGVESDQEDAVSKPDLMIELQEKVMDKHNIYLVIKITVPSDVEFNENITFDYFGFCKGTNYNTSDLLSGSRGCRLLEVLDGRKNVATYVVDISTDQKIKEGEELTAFFKDLSLNPQGDTSQILVEGMWSVSFTSSYTVSEDITVKGTDDMVYSFLDTTAAVTKLKLSPLGLTLISDVSNVPYEKWNTSDTRLTIRMKMIDGSERTVESPRSEEETLSSGGSITIFQKKGKLYSKQISQFAKTIDTSRVLGVYIENCYVPLKEFE